MRKKITIEYKTEMPDYLIERLVQMKLNELIEKKGGYNIKFEVTDLDCRDFI